MSTIIEKDENGVERVYKNGRLAATFYPDKDRYEPPKRVSWVVKLFLTVFIFTGLSLIYIVGAILNTRGIYIGVETVGLVGFIFGAAIGALVMGVKKWM